MPGITLPLMAAETSPTLRWDAALGESAVWDTGTTAVWEDEQGVESTYTSGSHVVFGEDDALNKAVEIVPEGVNAAAVELTGSGSFFCAAGFYPTPCFTGSGFTDGVAAMKDWDSRMYYWKRAE